MSELAEAHLDSGQGGEVVAYSETEILAANIAVVGREIVRQMEAINSTLNELGALLDRRL